MQKNEPDLPTTGTIIEEDRSISRKLTACIFKHIRRAGNNVAHEIAKYGLGFNEERLWLEDSPDFLQQAISTDIIVIE